MTCAVCMKYSIISGACTYACTILIRQCVRVFRVFGVLYVYVLYICLCVVFNAQGY